MNAQLKPEPLEMWTVVDVNGKAATPTTSPEYADAKCVVWDHEYPSLAPHRVVRLVEVA